MAHNFYYGLVARGTTPLADYSVDSGNYRTTALKMIEDMDPTIQDAFLEQKNLIYAAMTDSNRLVFLCACDSAVQRKLYISFLKYLQSRWYEKYGNNAENLAPYSENEEFGNKKIKEFLRVVSSERAAKLAEAQQNQEDFERMMAENLKKAFIRGELIDTILPKAEQIDQSSQKFHRQAKKVRQRICWQKWRWYIIAAIILIIIILIIVIVACGGFSFKKCKK